MPDVGDHSQRHTDATLKPERRRWRNPDYYDVLDVTPAPQPEAPVEAAKAPESPPEEAPAPTLATSTPEEAPEDLDFSE